MFVSLTLTDQLSSNRNYNDFLWKSGTLTGSIWAGLPLSGLLEKVSHCPFTCLSLVISSQLLAKQDLSWCRGPCGRGPCCAVHQCGSKLLTRCSFWLFLKLHLISILSSEWAVQAFHFLLCSRLRLSRTKYNAWFLSQVCYLVVCVWCGITVICS